ncbi:MAG: glycine cleavage system aminomethyltransferase GcvT [Terrimicrobiaceae bacterium]
MNQRTALYDVHVAAGGRMVDFAGWEMPVQYRGIIEEHRAVREACGVFDISHMGEFLVGGSGAAAWLDRLLTNRASKLSPGEAQYSLLLNDRGGVIDDLYVYRLAGEDFLLVVNASMISTDAAWMRERLVDGVDFEDASGRFSALAVQGPQAAKVFSDCFGDRLPAGRNRVATLEWSGETLFICTTGYTGEAGFEAICPNGLVVKLWETLLVHGAKPCGLGARDSLRLEMGYPLNGNDLNPERTPLEAGLGYFVDLGKEDFVGAGALREQKVNGVPTRLVGLVAVDKMPPMRPHYAVWHGEETVGETTSGGLSPTLGTTIAMAYLPAALSQPGTQVDVEVRGKKFPARVVKKPFLNITQ